MSQEARQRSVREKTQQLLQGSLKHVRVAALAAALVPLAAVAVTHAVAQAQGLGRCGGGAVTVRLYDQRWFRSDRRPARKRTSAPMAGARATGSGAI